MTARPLAPLRRRLRAFAADQSGVSAIEFAFVAPLLIIFYFGMAETCQLLMAQRRVNHSAAAVADLVSQANAVDSTSLTDIGRIGRTIMSPFPLASHNVRITSVVAGTGGATTVAWSYPAGGPSAGSAITIGTPLAAGESVIVADASYSYVSSIGYFIPAAKALSHRAELRPRRTSSISCAGC
jgi:Flp pilus assembly protein TadG